MTTTPNMFLNLPTPTQTLGPAWATQLNSAIELIDDHDHTENKGRRITPAAININSPLDFNERSAENVRSVKLVNLPDPVPATGSDVGMVYEREGELYFNDRDGNEIRITFNGGISLSFSDGSLSPSAIEVGSAGQVLTNVAGVTNWVDIENLLPSDQKDFFVAQTATVTGVTEGNTTFMTGCVLNLPTGTYDITFGGRTRFIANPLPTWAVHRYTLHTAETGGSFLNSTSDNGLSATASNNMAGSFSGMFRLNSWGGGNIYLRGRLESSGGTVTGRELLSGFISARKVIP